MFDGTTMLEGRTVVVERGRIIAVGPSGSVPVPAGTATVGTATAGTATAGGAGRSLLPGFIDAHVHLGLVSPAAVLRGGVTTVRDLGWPPDRVFELAARLSGGGDGPRVLAAGPILTAPGGYPARSAWAPPGTGLEVGVEAEARAAVRGVVARGASVVKVAQEPRMGPTMPPEVLSAVVREAHRAGLRVTSHLGSVEQLDVALDAGVDELAHGLWSDERIPDATLRRMVRQGMAVVPTLHIDPSRRRIENLRAFLAAGGRALYGTDMGNSGPPQGIDPDELALMVDAGMTPLGAIAAATSAAADYLGLEGRGRVVAGAVADLLLVEGHPGRDLGALRRPIMVLRG